MLRASKRKVEGRMVASGEEGGAVRNKDGSRICHEDRLWRIDLYSRR